MKLQSILSLASFSVASGGRSAPTYRESLLSLHKTLVSIPSISNHEEEAGTALCNYLGAHSYHLIRQFVPPDAKTNTTRFNVLAWPGDANELSAEVLLTSHIDVVPPFVPYSIQEGPITEDTQIFGRGSNDAKGSVAAMITAVEELLVGKQIQKNQVALLFVVGEETGGIGMRTFNDSLPGERSFHSVIFGEPTENKLACGHKGMFIGTIRAKGVAAHSGYPEQGKNANLLMARAVLNLTETDLGSSQRFGKTTFNPGVWEGGIVNNVIPENATVQFSARVATGNQSNGYEIVKARMEEVLVGLDPHGFELDSTFGLGPVELDCDVPGV